MTAPGRPGRFHPAALLGVLAVVLGLAALVWHAARPDDEHLLRALVDGDIAAANALLDRGASIHARVGEGEHAGKTVLMLAAQSGDPVLVDRLLRAGAEPDQDNGRGGTALMFAATQGHTGVVAVLLEAGADLDRQASNGWTAVMLATAKRHRDVIEVLAAAGADLDRADVYGWTPLMRAAEHGDTGTHDLLLALGADPARRNDQGLDAHDIARQAAGQARENARPGSQAAPDLLESGER